MDLHILPLLEHRLLQKIGPNDIDEVINQLSNKLSTSSVHVIFRIVKSCFEAAKERGYISSNPCEGVILPKIKKKKFEL